MVGIHNVTVDGCLLRRQQHMISFPVKKHILFAVYTLKTDDTVFGSGVAHTVTTSNYERRCLLFLHPACSVLVQSIGNTLSTLAFLFTHPQELHNLRNRQTQLCPLTYLLTSHLKKKKEKKSTTRISNSRQLATWTSLDGNKDFLTWITGLWRGAFPFQEGRNLNASAGEKHKKQSLHRGQVDSWAANPF